MEEVIHTIFFDADGPLRTTVPDAELRSQSESAIVMLLRSRESHESLFSRLEERWKACQRRARDTLLEESEGEMWVRGLLPEYEPNLVYANAPRLTRLWLDRMGRRETRTGAAEAVRELRRRGYRLGLLCNSPSETDLPDWLVSEGMADCFHTVLLSCNIRLRTPDRAAYRLACRCAGTHAAQCAYISADPVNLEGAAGAGFGLCVRMAAPLESLEDSPYTAASAPEDLPGLFPALL